MRKKTKSRKRRPLSSSLLLSRSSCSPNAPELHLRHMTPSGVPRICPPCSSQEKLASETASILEFRPLCSHAAEPSRNRNLEETKDVLSSPLLRLGSLRFAPSQAKLPISASREQFVDKAVRLSVTGNREGERGRENKGGDDGLRETIAADSVESLFIKKN